MCSVIFEKMGFQMCLRVFESVLFYQKGSWLYFLMFLGGLLYLVFRFFTNVIAGFRFCRLLRFAEMNVFLTRFSDLSYIYSGFSVFEKTSALWKFPYLLRLAVCGYLLPYCGSQFAGILLLITACALRQWDAANDKLVEMNYVSVRSVSFYTFDWYLSKSGYSVGNNC